MKIAIQSWFQGKVKELDAFKIHEDFESKARIYYADACKFILQLSVREFSILLLACSVHWPWKGDYVAQTSLSAKNLVDAAVIFPYSGSDHPIFVIPSIYWQGFAAHADIAVRAHWGEVVKELHSLVPGLEWKHLLISFEGWWTSALCLSEIGNMWEDLLAASLAVVYQLWQLENPGQASCALSQIYEIATKAQAFTLVDSMKVNFSQGIKYPDHEVTTNQNIGLAIYVNRNAPTSHHDIIMYSSPSPVAVQCKHSLQAPTANQLTQPLEGAQRLLWFYLGYDEDDSKPPKQFKGELIQSKIKAIELGFLSGAGCISGLNIDFLILMKKLVKTMQQKE